MEPAPGAPRRERLFFAVWPDAVARARLEGLSREVVTVAGGRAIPPERIHLTLAFLGLVEATRLPELDRIARAMPAAAVALALDRVGSFRRARVAWAGMEETPPALVALQAALSDALSAGGFELEERPFVPHVTLARQTERALPKARIDAIEWRARELTLVRSELGTGRYTRLAAWPLED